MFPKLIFFLSIVVLFSGATKEGCKPEVSDYSKGRSCQSYGGLKPPNESTCKCGISQDALETQNDRIIGGRVVRPPYKYPWMVSVLRSKRKTCGGSIVSRTFVLTAAHCFLNPGVIKKVDKDQQMCLTFSGSFKKCFGPAALYGVRETGTKNNANKYYPAQQYIKHPKFDIEGMDNDIALIHLKTPFKCSAYSKPICLPDRVQTPQVGTELITTGWGRTHQNPGKGPQSSEKLLEAQLKLLPKNECEKNAPGKSTHVCAKSPTQGTCMGDSGGPLFGAVNSKFYVFGLTSFGKSAECNPQSPQFYTEVKQYVGWIKKTIMSNSKEVISD